MPQYFFDLDDGKTDYFDTIGTDISDPGQLRSEAVRFLASVFRDAARDIDDQVILASVRDEAGRIVLTTTLTLQSDWRDARTGPEPRRSTVTGMISENGFDAVEAANATRPLPSSKHGRTSGRPCRLRLPIRWKRLKFAGYISRASRRRDISQSSFHSP